jgi:hypothetical protein
MTFKDALSWDTEHAFLNLEEFGEEVEINGIRMTAVRYDGAQYEYGSMRQELPPLNPELPERSIVLYVRTDMLDSDVVQGGSVTFDGELCQVESRHDGLGCMTKLVLGRRGYL